MFVNLILKLGKEILTTNTVTPVEHIMLYCSVIATGGVSVSSCSFANIKKKILEYKTEYLLLYIMDDYHLMVT